jgi:hypothetical protein
MNRYALLLVACVIGGAMMTAGVMADSSADRSIDRTELAPGESTTVTVTVSFDEATDFEIDEQFDPAFADVSIVDADGASFSAAESGRVVARYGQLGDDPRSSATLVYEVQVPADAADGETFDISPGADSANQAGTDTITVVDDSENGDENGAENGGESGTETGSENGAENGGENGTENGGENGTENGAENGGENGTENGSENGGENGTENGSENGGENGTENGSENGTENGGESENGSENGTENGTENGGENSAENGSEDEPDTDDGDGAGFGVVVALVAAVAGVLAVRAVR